MNVRVLLVTKGLDLGGIERVVTDLAVGLSRVGGDGGVGGDQGDGVHVDVEVDVALVNSDRNQLVSTITDAGVRVHHLGGTDGIGWGAGRRLVSLVRSGGFDVVHVHGPLPSALVRLAAALPGSNSVRVITTSHTPWSSLHPATRAVWRATSGLDAATVAVSAAVAESLPGRARGRAQVIPHGIDPVRIAAARETAAAAADDRADDSAEGAVTVIAAASHRDAKNHPNLLRAIRLAIDSGAPIRAMVIGDGPNLGAHVALAEEIGLGEHITFVPATLDVLAAIAGADILAVASDYEGQPIVVAEALALGVPVVATAVGRVPEMVNSDVGRVVAPRDSAALAAALTELATLPELRATMSSNATRQLNSWTLSDVIAAHLELYQRA